MELYYISLVLAFVLIINQIVYCHSSFYSAFQGFSQKQLDDLAPECQCLTRYVSDVSEANLTDNGMQTRPFYPLLWFVIMPF